MTEHRTKEKIALVVEDSDVKYEALCGVLGSLGVGNIIRYTSISKFREEKNKYDTVDVLAFDYQLTRECGRREFTQEHDIIDAKSEFEDAVILGISSTEVFKNADYNIFTNPRDLEIILNGLDSIL